MVEIIHQLLASPDCCIKHRPSIAELSDSLPDDVRYFFGRYHGGRLFYNDGYPTPQFGCNLGLEVQPVSRSLGFDEKGGYCQGEQFDHLYAIADYEETGDYMVAVVSTLPDRFGYIYRLSYALGDPTLRWSDVAFVAPSLTRWLEIHIEAWDVYKEDWREGLRYFGDLITAESRAIGASA